MFSTVLASGQCFQRHASSFRMLAFIAVLSCFVDACHSSTYLNSGPEVVQRALNPKDCVKTYAAAEGKRPH